ncbi:PLD nuclease N-terminal domain-containing protein [Streptomyces sp. NBC_00306]|uniref:PLD nuclease N-terminal domain-containing protein n=1 Tax=Streptomyces sp. NBC_00306 TaxID=2975708 RepID=UPI002E2E32A0|nr:PLD nuclease N-terminal domain-containing protein [Streptomyces sp. NBC_00306]
MLRYLPFLLVLALWIYAFIDCLNTPEKEVRHLPKVVWVIIVLLFGQVLLGPVAWLVAGRPRKGARGGGSPFERRRTQWVAPDDNPDFLKSLKDEKAEKDARAAKDADEAQAAKDADAEELRRREREDDDR